MYKQTYDCCDDVGHQHAFHCMQLERIQARRKTYEAILEYLMLVNPLAVRSPAGDYRPRSGMSVLMHHHEGEARKALRRVMEMIGAQYYPEKNHIKLTEALEYMGRVTLHQFLDLPPILIDYCLELVDNHQMNASDAQEREDLLLLILGGLGVMLTMKDYGSKIILTRRSGPCLFELVKKLHSLPVQYHKMTNALELEIVQTTQKQTDIIVKQYGFCQLRGELKESAERYFKRQDKAYLAEMEKHPERREWIEKYGLVFGLGSVTMRFGVTPTFQWMELKVLEMFKENGFQEITLKETLERLVSGFEGKEKENWCCYPNLDVLWNLWYYHNHLGYFWPRPVGVDLLKDLHAFRGTLEGQGNYDLLLGITKPTDIYFLKNIPLPAIVAVEVKSHYAQKHTKFQELSRMMLTKEGRHYVVIRGDCPEVTTLCSPGDSEMSWYNQQPIGDCSWTIFKEE